MSGCNIGSILTRWAHASSKIFLVVVVGLGNPVLEGEASAVSLLYVKSRDPLGVISGALVQWGSAGRSKDDSALLLGELLGDRGASCGCLFNAFCWGSGGWIRALLAMEGAGFSSDWRGRFCFFFADVLNVVAAVGLSAMLLSS